MGAIGLLMGSRGSKWTSSRTSFNLLYWISIIYTGYPFKMGDISIYYLCIPP